MIKILTDFDRTMVRMYPSPDPLAVLREKIVDYYRNAGVPATVTDSTDQDGYHAWHTIHRWVTAEWENDASITVNDGAESLVTKYELDRARQVSLLPGVHKAVLDLDDSVILGIVSSNSDDVIEWILERDGLLKRIALIQGRPHHPFDPGLLKPSPALLKKALVTLDCPPGTWYIGDDLIDIEAAHAVDMRAAGVATGLISASELKAHGADLVEDSFSAVLLRLTQEGVEH